MADDSWRAAGPPSRPGAPSPYPALTGPGVPYVFAATPTEPAPGPELRPEPGHDHEHEHEQRPGLQQPATPTQAGEQPAFEGRRSRRRREAAEAAGVAGTAAPTDPRGPTDPTGRTGPPSLFEPTRPVGPPAPPDPRLQDPRLQDPRLQDPRFQDPQFHDPQFHDPQFHDPQFRDPRFQDPEDADDELRGFWRVVQVAGLPLAAALLLGWGLTTLIGDVRWGPLSVLPVGLACLSPLLPIPSLAVITMALHRRSWTALVPALAATVLPWAFVVGYVVPATAPRGELLPLRALLVTAHNGAADADEITAAARAQGADIVVVTELSSTLAHRLTRSGLARTLSPRYVSVPEGAAPAAGLGIYSRFPVDEVRTLQGTHWPAVRARVMVGDTPVTLVAGHAVQPSAGDLDRWRRDLATFRTAADIKGPVLVLANLNATPWNPQFRRVVSGRLHDAADVLGRGMRPTWPNWTPVPVLPTDHALVAGAGVTSLGTVTIAGTDHRALTVELSIPRRSTSS